MRRALLSLPFVLAAVFAHSTPARSQSLYNVKVTMATKQTWGSEPLKWWGSMSYCVEDQCFIQEACTAIVLPFGNSLPNGPVEFPGSLSTSGTLGNWCLSVAPGTCAYIDVDVLSSPDRFGATYKVTARRAC
jgi:hypothetical protein